MRATLIGTETEVNCDTIGVHITPQGQKIDVSMQHDIDSKWLEINLGMQGGVAIFYNDAKELRPLYDTLQRVFEED